VYTRFQERARATAALQVVETLLSEDQAWVNRDFAIVFINLLEQPAQSGRSA
jgi:hypothetical protein